MARIGLTDFRGYARLRLDLDPRPVVLTGPNGAGKTNLLEAVSFLVPGRGLRRARLAEVGRRDPGAAAGRPWAVAATVATPDGPVDIGTGLEATEEADDDGAGRRAVRIDGVARRGQAALADVVSALWLTPEMDRLFTESAGARRRFLDRMVYGFDRGHAARVAAYEHAMRERGRLLREGAGRADPAWLGALEARMAENGIAIVAARQALVGRLNTACANGVGPFPAARLSLGGEVEAWLAAGPALAAEDRLRDRLVAARREDAESGGAAAGAHKSVLDAHHILKGVPAAQCSTGEQKALLVSITLAQARLQAVERGAPPILLLDEVAAHLDAARRAALYEEIAALGAQAWMTGTDADAFAPWGAGAQFLRVEDARLTPARH
ncbi:MAG: DNA replication/repair protein RecF [Rhodospirillaceae bacterium]